MMLIIRIVSGFFVLLRYWVQEQSHISLIFRVGRINPAFFIFGLTFFMCATFVLSDEARANCTKSVCYEYDSLGRLSKAIMPGGGPGGVDQTIEYTYDDAGNRTQVSVANAGGNSPPNAVSDFATGVAWQNTFIYPLSNDTDPDNDSLIISSVDVPCITQGSGSYLLCLFGTSGIWNFSYTVSDGNGGTDTGTIMVSVSGGGGGFP